MCDFLVSMEGKDRDRTIYIVKLMDPEAIHGWSGCRKNGFFGEVVLLAKRSRERMKKGRASRRA